MCLQKFFEHSFEAKIGCLWKCQKCCGFYNFLSISFLCLIEDCIALVVEWSSFDSSILRSTPKIKQFHRYLCTIFFIFEKSRSLSKEVLLEYNQ